MLLLRSAFILAALCSALHAEDWPMWRYDAGRTAASSEQLPRVLHLQWERQYSPRAQVWDDVLNHDLMTYDKVFEPVVLGDRLFISFNDQDKVVALDLHSGQELWTFFTGGPVRLPPVAWKDKVYVTSDDGFLYCIAANDGHQLWSLRGGPSDRKAQGNGRLVSAWPARGGPVIRDGQLYFAASIWPFMGTFIYALDPNTGHINWVNDGSGAQFIKQPHSAPAFAGVAPQGALVATQDLLLIPGGRSVPAAFDRKTGALRYFNLADGGKGNGGSFVAAGDRYFYVHTRGREVRTYDLATGTQGKSTCGEPVITNDRIYAAATTEKGAAVVRELGTSETVYWEIPVDASGDLIKAGDHLYAAGKSSITAIQLPKNTGKPTIAWSMPIKGNIQRLLAANGHLIAVTQEGSILTFGAAEHEAKTITDTRTPQKPDPDALTQAREFLQLIGDPNGQIVCHGTEDMALIDALVHESQVPVIIVEPDAAKVIALRTKLNAAGQNGIHATVQQASIATFQPPSYFAHFTLINSAAAATALKDKAMLQKCYESVRPYGGILCVPLGTVSAELVKEAGLANASLRPSEKYLFLVKEGALPGAADWTHQYGDIGNTVKSDDSLVKAPLGVLWFGGSSNADVLPRHGHGPPEQVVSGRLFIEGMNSVSARDVYSGRALWKHDFGDLGTFGIYYNETYEDTPLSTAYNQKHIPGANGRGSNFVATDDTVYVAVKGECHALDARTGTLRQRIPLRFQRDGKAPAEWGYIGVLDDLLLAGDGFAHYSLKLGGDASKTPAATVDDYSASDGLAAFDRHTGQLRWRIKARHSFLHNGIVAGNGRIYCLDKLTTYAEGLLDRRGTPLPSDYRIIAIDAKTGTILWEQKEDIFGTWLGYSKTFDILLQASSKATDRLGSEGGVGLAASRGSDGQVLWQDLKSSYTGPCIIHNDLIFTGANSYQASNGVINLRDGTPHLVRNPLTGQMEPWRINRTYGCNTVIASENLLTYRSGAAGFYDLATMSGTANLGGFKSGCTSNLVVANGVLNAPDYTRTCSCAYQNQTSLALVHMPEMELWAYSQFGLDGKDGDRIKRVGINFGAPGDRRAPDGTLWLEYPNTDEGISPGLTIQVKGGDQKWFRRHSSQIASLDLPWVGASGVSGAVEINIEPTLRKGELKKPPSASEEDEAKGKKSKSKKPAPEVKPPPPILHVNHPPAPYTVRLHFAEPDDLAKGQRIFNVMMQGKTVLQNFDIAQAAEATATTIMKEFRHITIGGEFKLTLTPSKTSSAPPVLCGVELIAE
ncbi:MAG: PQQ-binding-like beta-propeller repeat protein [Verrucomicrobiales bacterium]|nr:PQQ-binding-like beta-propeller repeat protein [Verrucomicrobiales bacterium]MCP5560456.1 PQQ-binding-like beta-propeller repeat protein [Verrucomicrobiaceae bacterium]